VEPRQAGADTGALPSRGPARRVTEAWLLIAACAAIGFALRWYQLTRPGYLYGVTEYDDGVLFGNALRLISGVMPYRDFSMVQPPGSMLVIAPAALLAKAAGSTAGLAASRMLTLAVDTANIVLIGTLVRHRGPVVALAACGWYAVYPDSIVAAHTFLLEPWLNMFCLLGALAIVNGDQLAGTRRLAWGGAALGFAVAVKIWAFVPLVIAIALVALVTRRGRPAAVLAGGAVLGLGIPLLPFLVLAPGAFVRDVFTSQAVRESGAVTGQLTRLTDLAGAQLLPAWSPRTTLVIIAAVILAGCWAAAGYTRRRFTPLDGYALACLAAVTIMFLLPRLYYAHYGSFDGTFLALAVALPLGALPPGVLTARLRHARHALPPRWKVPGPTVFETVVAAGLTLFIAVTAVTHMRAESQDYGDQRPAAAARLIPAGACVLTNDAAFTVAANRFNSEVPGCPSMVDSYGTYFAMTGGRFRAAGPAVLSTVTTLWQTDLAHAQYVWFTSGTGHQIPWTPQLYAYFVANFQLIGLAAVDWTNPAVPCPGLYIRVGVASG
jgi:hypothetical protein